MKADASELLCLKDLLNKFAESTGLKVNFHKSLILPINISDSKMLELAAVLGFQIGSMPFTYLGGLPMGTTKSKFEDLMPTIDRVKRRWLTQS